MQSLPIAPPSLVVAAASHEGLVRGHNEDAWRIATPEAVPAAVLAGKGVLLVVCDGVGGLQAGEVASGIATRVAFDAYYADGSVNRTDALRRAALAAHEAIRRVQAENASPVNMASTIVMAVIVNGQVCVANVGDSRCYLWRAGRLIQLSIDHSWVNAQVQAGALQPEQAHASDYHNVLTRILGGGNASNEADLVCEAWLAGDKLLLCSDGLWNMVRDQDIAQVLSKAGADARFAAEAMVRAANEAGGTDNITCIVAIDPSQPTAIVRSRRRKSAFWMGIGMAAAIMLLAFAVLAPMLRSAGSGSGASMTVPALAAVEATVTLAPVTAQSSTATPVTAVLAQTSPPLAATATVEANVVRAIRFCRTPARGQCRVTTNEFNRRSVDVFGVWAAEDVAGIPVITMQWTVNGESRLAETCTQADGKCLERNVNPTLSGIRTDERGEYRLDVLADGRRLLTGTFVVN